MRKPGSSARLWMGTIVGNRLVRPLLLEEGRNVVIVGKGARRMGGGMRRAIRRARGGERMRQIGINARDGLQGWGYRLGLGGRFSFSAGILFRITVYSADRRRWRMGGEASRSRLPLVAALMPRKRPGTCTLALEGFGLRTCLRGCLGIDRGPLVDFVSRLRLFVFGDRAGFGVEGDGDKTVHTVGLSALFLGVGTPLSRTRIRMRVRGLFIGRKIQVEHRRALVHGVPALLLNLAEIGHDLAKRGLVIAAAFRFGVDLANVVRERILLFLQAKDALDEGFDLEFGAHHTVSLVGAGRRLAT